MLSLNERVLEIYKIGLAILQSQLEGGIIKIDNEASLQLQFSSILKTIGELFVFRADERFFIELEKVVKLKNSQFVKSKSEKAKIDIWFAIENRLSGEISRCAIELKYFKKHNHREPNNRYDVFKDLANLENYGEFSDSGYMIVLTDHEHYVSKSEYSPDTADFDFRNKKIYTAGRELNYNTEEPYGSAIVLKESYEFKWIKLENNLHILSVPVHSKT